MSELIHTILFNKNVICHNQDGVSFRNETTGKTAISLSLRTKPPQKCLFFNVGWTTNPQPGEIIRWIYDGTGSYQDEHKTMMLAQDLILINCSDEEVIGERIAEVIATKI